MGAVGKAGKVVGFTAVEVGALANVTFLVGGVEDAVDADHGKLVFFLCDRPRRPRSSTRGQMDDAVFVSSTRPHPFRVDVDERA